MSFISFSRALPRITYAKFSYNPILNEEGQLCGFLCPIFSETDNEQALKESEKQLTIELGGAQTLQDISSRLIEESNIDAMCDQILEAAMTIMNSNCSSIQILDTEHHVLNLLAWKNFHPESVKFWQEVSIKAGTPCGAALRHNQRVIIRDINCEESMQNSDSLPYFRYSNIRAVQTTPLTTREGRMLGMISTHWHKPHELSSYALALFDVLMRQLSDVIERQQVQQDLKEMDLRKDEFLAVLAHELRNPLLPVKNAVYLLQRTQDAAMLQQLTDILDRQVNHMVRLVDDLLEVARIKTGKIELNKESNTLVAIINNALEVSKPLLDSKQHQVHITMPHESFTVHTDMIRMTQTFANLLNNAAKYTPNNGIINITVLQKDMMVHISIKDNGIGISQEMLPKVFEM